MSAAPAIPYSVTALEGHELDEVRRALVLRTDLPLERVHAIQAIGTAVDPAFFLLPADAQLLLPSTPFAAFEWPAAVEEALVRSFVLVTPRTFIDAAHADGLSSLHAGLYRAQYFHRACAAIRRHRGAREGSSSLSGLLVSMAIDDLCDADIRRQCQSLDLRIEAYVSNGRTRGHLAVATSPHGHMPTLIAGDLRAIAHRPRTEQRTRVAELVTAAFQPFRRPGAFDTDGSHSFALALP